MTNNEMVAALRKHAARQDDPDTATALRWAADRISQLAEAIKPFLQIACRLPDGAPQLNEHEFGPDHFYVFLHVSAFRQLAMIIAEDRQ